MKIYVHCDDSSIEPVCISVYYLNKLLYTCSFYDYNKSAFEYCVHHLSDFVNAVQELCAQYGFEAKYDEDKLVAFMMAIYASYDERQLAIDVFDTLHISIERVNSIEDNETRPDFDDVVGIGTVVAVPDLRVGDVIADTDADSYLDMILIIGEISKHKTAYHITDSYGNSVGTYEHDGIMVVLPPEYKKWA